MVVTTAASGGPLLAVIMFVEIAVAADRRAGGAPLTVNMVLPTVASRGPLLAATMIVKTAFVEDQLLEDHRCVILTRLRARVRACEYSQKTVFGARVRSHMLRCPFVQDVPWCGFTLPTRTGCDKHICL